MDETRQYGGYVIDLELRGGAWTARVTLLERTSSRHTTKEEAFREMCRWIDAHMFDRQR